MPPPIGLVTLLTDFGHSDPYVGIVKGMVKRAHPRADVIDLCHEVPPQDLRVAAFFVAAARGRFPSGTVHVVVVDPGVGSARRLLAILAADCYWLLPDNGVGTPLLDTDGPREVRAVDAARLGLRAESRTFHGRDLFAPIAGMLCGGRYSFRSLGERIDDPVRLEPVAEQGHRILLADRFGNLISDLPEHALAGGAAAVEIDGTRVPIVETYASAPTGTAVAVVSSYGTIEVAVVEGNAQRELGVEPGASIRLVAPAAAE